MYIIIILGACLSFVKTVYYAQRFINVLVTTKSYRLYLRDNIYSNSYGFLIETRSSRKAKQIGKTFRLNLFKAKKDFLSKKC